MSDLEYEFLFHIRALRLPEPIQEYRFTQERRWRFDFAWPVKRVALEVEGAIWTGGRHTRGAGYEADCEKYNEALVRGWKVLRVTAGQIKRGKAIEWLQICLALPA